MLASIVSKPVSRNLIIKKTADRRSAFYLRTNCAAERIALENYITDKYRHAHNASVSEFLPLLLEMRNSSAIQGCIGLQPGCFKPMFLEQYLASPIEQQVAKLTQQPIDRQTIIEVGNLVATRKGCWMPLFVVLATALSEAGFEWMTFTATNEVERLMRYLSFEPWLLIAADPSRVENSHHVWGTYYEHNPRVMVGSLQKAADVIKGKSSLTAIADNHDQEIMAIARSLRDYRRLSDILR